MREYRRRVAEGAPRKVYKKWTPAILREMAAMRAQGASIKEIGRKFDVDPAYAGKLIKRAAEGGD